MEHTQVGYPLTGITFDVPGEIGIGADIPWKAMGSIVSPELKFSGGLFNVKKDVNNIYGNTLESLHRRNITFGLYIRG